MDRKEAIETLREIKGYYTMDRDFSYYGDEYNGLTDEDNTALDMAIEALQKYDECVEALKEMLELKAEPKCKQCLYNPEHPFTVNCSEFPTGSDLISRQDAIDELAKFVPYAISDKSTESYVNGLTDAYNLICQLPTVEPRLTEDGTLEVNALDARAVKRVLIGDSKNWGGLYYPDEEPRTGKWEITNAYPHNVYCSECHAKVAQTHWVIWEDGSLPRNFCPNCGCAMTKEQI